VQANEIHAVAPFSFPFASDQPVIQVKVGSQIAASLEVAEYGSDAAVFTVNGQGAIVNQDGTVNTPANPARLGSVVSIYATGTGYLTDASHTVLNPLADGQVTRSRRLTSSPRSIARRFPSPESPGSRFLAAPRPG